MSELPTYSVRTCVRRSSATVPGEADWFYISCTGALEQSWEIRRHSHPLESLLDAETIENRAKLALGHVGYLSVET
jgi:hypothetical protein